MKEGGDERKEERDRKIEIFFFYSYIISVLHPSTSVCLPRLHFSFTGVSYALLAPLSGSLLITCPSYFNRPSFTSSLMFTTPTYFLISSFLLCHFNEILHIFLIILISVTSSLLSSSLLGAADSVPYNNTGLITLL